MPGDSTILMKSQTELALSVFSLLCEQKAQLSLRDLATL